MKEKILALLTSKFTGVRKDGLARLAGALSLQAAGETEAGALVDKLTLEKVKEFITDYRKDVDKEVTDANTTFEGNLKKKYEFVEKKGAEPGKDPNPSDPNDIATVVANAVKAAVEPLQQKISAIEVEKTTQTRLQQLEAKFKNVPDSYKTQRIADAKLFVNNMDEAAFAEYLSRTEADVTAFNQELANKGLLDQSKPLFGGKNQSEEDAFVDQLREMNVETPESKG